MIRKRCLDKGWGIACAYCPGTYMIVEMVGQGTRGSRLDKSEDLLI
jgi:hypothetical protein